MSLQRNPLDLDLEQYRLANGLTVLLHPDKQVPVVAVNLWYHVGSKDEDPCRTGLAHLFEHLMFEGSAHHDDEYFKPLQEAGGSINGTTGNDRTNYYEVVPANFLERALWLEADRLGCLLPVLTQAKLENQRAVVKNEGRQRVDNQPYGHIPEEMACLLYPEAHPYRWPVIGSMEHLESCSLADITAFFQQFYCPVNASLCIAGTFERGQAKEWVERYFGPIAGGTVLPRPVVQTPLLTETKCRRLQDNVALPRLDMVWLTVPRLHADEPALDFAAHILAGRSKDSRLKRRLIHDQKLVTTVGAFHFTQRLTGQFSLRAFGLPHTALEQVKAIILEEVDQLRQQPPGPEEMQRARNDFRNSAYSRLETILGKADALNHYLFYAGAVDGGALARELEQYEQVTAEQVSAVLRRYLGAGCAIVETLPRGGGQIASGTAKSDEDRSARVPKKRELATSGMPPAGPTPSFSLPTIERATTAMGLRVAVVRMPRLPRIDFQLILDAGSSCESAAQLGLARLTAEVLDEGTLLREGLDLARRLDLLGARLGVSAGLESSTVALRTHRGSLGEAFPLFAEVVAQPAFHAVDLERERQRLLAEIAFRDKQPSSQADDAIAAAIFGAEHPYGRTMDGTAATLAGLSAEHLRQFHQQYYHPSTATLLAVGDTGLDEVLRMVETHLEAWGQGVASSRSHAFLPPTPSPLPWQVIDRPEAAQTVVRLGSLSTCRKTPDYFPLLLLNTVLGGQFASRLNLNLREDKGYTYSVRSAFSLRRYAGAFHVGGDIESAATVPAVAEMVREITDLAGLKPMTAEELAIAKAFLVRRFPARFETTGGMAAHLAQLAIYGLPDDYYQGYTAAVEAVTLEQVHEAAHRHLRLEDLKVVVVGSRVEAAELEQTWANAQNRRQSLA